MCKEVVTKIRSEQSEYTVENVYNAANIILNSYNKSRDNGCFEPNKKEVKVVKIAINMGFSIYQFSLPKEVGGCIMINEDLIKRLGSDKVIIVNQNAQGNQKRFVIAHELGNYLFNFRNTIKDSSYENISTYQTMFEYDSTSQKPEEALANRFAAELLMPKELFVEEFKKAIVQWGKVYYDVATELSTVFNVPIKSVFKRMEQLYLYL